MEPDRNRSVRLRLWSFSVLLLVSIFAVSCTRDDDEQTSTDAPLSAHEILRGASARLADTPTIRFGLDIEGETFIDEAESIQLIEARGEMVRPDRVRTDFKIRIFRGVTITTSLIIIGEQRWSTDLITGSWGPAPEEFGYDPSILFDNQGGIGPVMERIENPELVSNEEIRGRESYVIRAAVNASIIDAISAGTLEGSPITVDLWIDHETLDLLRARLSEPVDVAGRDAATWTLDLSAHGADFRVDPPS